MIGVATVLLCPGHLKARIAEIAHKITKKFLRKRIPQEFFN